MQRQLGHASIQLTVDTYGRWLPMGNKAAVDRLDNRIGSKVVASGVRAKDCRTSGMVQGPSEDTQDEPSVDDYEPEW